jgi:predicted Zn finger-like uncharacterized protein
MILTCPSCATRYQADETKFPAAGRQVRCAKCAHVWHQAAPEPEEPPQDIAEPVIVMPNVASGAPATESASEAFRPSSIGSAPMRPRTSVTPQNPRLPLLPMIGVALGWIGLIAVVLLIGLSAVRYRQEITVIWPQSAGVYSSLGMNVNTHGIDFVHVDYHRESEDGQVVLAVAGRIVNNGTRDLPVPQSVRVTLSDSSNHELYHWNFTPEAQSLRPGQSIPFLTRLSSPPAAARHLEVRFAKDVK